MNKRIRTRSQIIRQEILLRVVQEKIIIGIFIFAFGYNLISNFLSNICLIGCNAELVNIWNIIDDTFRNICYGIMSGIIFYLVNDVYKNVVKRIPNMDEMFYELLSLQVDAWNMLKTMSHNKYNKNMSREQTFQSIMNNMCIENAEFKNIGSVLRYHNISVEDSCNLVDMWRESLRKRSVFLGTYGDLLERKEVQILGNFDDYRISEEMSFLNIQIEKMDEDYIQVNEHDLTYIINRIIGYKFYLTELSKKYVRYAYRTVYLNHPIIEEDFA